MSINVTVHGNPISISKGKMVTSDVDAEFKRRRLMRLQQVRQQSKEIAANVRNRVRKEKERYISKTEQKGEQDLQRWKQRKLLAFQQQYEDCVKNVGEAHAIAAAEVNPSEILYEKAIKNNAEASIRGKQAHQKLTKEDNEKRKKLEQQHDMRKKTRKLENERSVMVAALNRSKKKKNIKRKKIFPKVTSHVDMDSTDLFVSDEENISGNINKNKKKKEANISIANSSLGNVSKHSKASKNVLDSSEENSSGTIINNKCKKKKKANISIAISSPGNVSKLTKASKNALDSSDENISGNKIKNKNKKKKKANISIAIISPGTSKQTRASETALDSSAYDSSFGFLSSPSLSNHSNESPRKNRSILSPNKTPPTVRREYSFNSKKSNDGIKKTMKSCKTKTSKSKDSEKSIDTAVDNDFQITSITSRILQRKDIVSKRDSDDHIDAIRKDLRKPTKCVLNIESHKICDICCEKKCDESTQLPYVPPTSVEPAAVTLPTESKTSKVKYYDKINHFGKEYTAKPIIQKITKANIKVNPSTENEETENTLKLMQNRDKVARDRGVKAMEKEKIQKDYKQLMNELPILQRQEQMAQMHTHSPAFHMNEQRLEELEKRRQNKIENIFEKYYNKAKVLETPLVTICPVQKSPPADEMKLPFKALDVTESPVQLNVAEWTNEYTETNTQMQEDIHNKQKALVNLLQRVNKQRELLLREVSTLPPTSNLQQILQDDEILKLCLCGDKQNKIKHANKSKLKNMVSTATSPVLVKCSSKSTSPSHGSVNSSSERSTKQMRKKHKPKKELLNKNEGTQTSPCICNEKSNSLKITKSEKISEEGVKKCLICCNKCVCTTDDIPEKLCEIVIHMNDKSDIKICKSEEEPVGKKVILNVSKSKKTIGPQNVNDMSSTTTFNSLPEYQQKLAQPIQISKQKVCPLNIPQCTDNISRQKYKDMLHDKPQQTNIDNKCKQKSPQSPHIKKEITPNLLRYIRKLLSMSRQSIDELTISSISETSTPRTSIVDNIENNSLAQLQNVMQYYNLGLNDIQKHLSVQEPTKLSTEVSSSNAKQKQDIPNVETNQYQKETSQEDYPYRKSYPKGSPNVRCLINDTTDKTNSAHISSPQKSENSQSGQSSHRSSPKNLPYLHILSKYKQLTETCCDRITKLTEMINTVRLEKERLLSPENSDRYEAYESSVTSYLDLPKTFDFIRTDSNGNKTGGHSNSNSSTSSSLSQDAVDRYLFAIDKNICKEPSTCQQNTHYTKNDEIDKVPVNDNSNNRNTIQELFVPMLQGIPKYVESSENQASNFINSPVKQFLLNCKSKPPPALLRNVNKHNLDIDMTPHELSTIVELDTIISSRNVSEIAILTHRAQEKKKSSKNEEYQEDTIIDKEASGFVTLTPEYFKTNSNEKNEDCDCNPNNPVEMTSTTPHRKIRPASNQVTFSGITPLPSELSTSSPEDMELTLRTMGLGWAVSTLRKTQEALALSSSSSSQEPSTRKHLNLKHSNSSNNSSSSSSNSNFDVSLKNVLNKELIRKISSSTLISNSSGTSPNLQVLEDISEIRDPTNLNRDASQHRTSTPVQNSKSTDSKKELFTGDSDISSVRLNSEELFLSIPNLSLSSTNKSLSKSK